MAITFELLPAAVEEIIDRLDSVEKLLMNMQQQPEPQPAGYLTRAQVCQRLHITLPTVHSWMKSGKLQPYHIGGRTLFKEAEVLQAVKPVNYDPKKKGGNL